MQQDFDLTVERDAADWAFVAGGFAQDRKQLLDALQEILDLFRATNARGKTAFEAHASARDVQRWRKILADVTNGGGAS